MVQLMQQWLSTSRKSKNPVAVQSMRLLSQLVFSIHQHPKEVGFNANKGMSFM